MIQPLRKWSIRGLRPRRGGSAVKRMSWYLLTLLLLFAWTGIGFAADPQVDNKMGIITGGEKGTYYQFGLDLQKLMRLSEITLNVFNSKGSIENVFAVYQRP